MDVSTLNVRVCKMAGKNMHKSKNNNSSHEDNMLKVNHKYDILNSCHNRQLYSTRVTRTNNHLNAFIYMS